MTVISQQTISARAYQLWEQAGCSGDAGDHWRQAEHELRVAADPASLLLRRFSARPKHPKLRPLGRAAVGEAAGRAMVPLRASERASAADVMVTSAPLRPTLHDIIAGCIAQTTRNLEMATACSIALAQGWQDLVLGWWGLTKPWLKTGVDDLYGLTRTSQDWSLAQSGATWGILHSPGWVAAPAPEPHDERSSPVVVLYPGEWRHVSAREPLNEPLDSRLAQPIRMSA
jgi:hypothetical protein